jgi:hypothetical protein
MARYTGSFSNWTPAASGVADTTNYTDSQYHAIQGIASQRFEIREIYMGGLAAASSPTNMVFGRDSTVGATLTAGRFAAMDSGTNAPASLPTSFQVSTTKPQRSATLGMLLVLAFNAFGGIVRWVNGPDEIISGFGATASLGELSLSAFTGGTSGALSSAIVVEVA